MNKTVSVAQGAATPATPSPTHIENLVERAEDPDEFIGLALRCFRIVGWALIVSLLGVLALDGAAVAARLCGLAAGAALDGGPSSLGSLGLAGLGAAAIAAAFLMLGSIQVRYTFEHAHIHKRHFYALKLARRREAAAALRSLAVKDAVPAVKALMELRRDTGLLDRRLAIEMLMLRRRWRDLTWFPATLVVSGAAIGTVVMARSATGAILLPAAFLASGPLLWGLVLLWAAERVGRVREVLSASPPELSSAFDPNPDLQAAVERLLVRVNRHFDRLNGAADLGGMGIEEEEAGM
jgi:hypothetical protein